MKIDFKGSSWSETAKNNMNLLLLHGFVFDSTERNGCAGADGCRELSSHLYFSIYYYTSATIDRLFICRFLG